MTSRHSAFTIGTSPGAKYADRFTGCRADVVHVARDHSKPALSRLERSFSDLLLEVRPERGLRLRIFIDGKRQALRPAIQEQLFLIGREAAMNALRHSQATKIEVEVQYLRDLLRVFVRDNGRGIDPEAVQKESDSHWGLRGMRDRAETIGARFEIRSRSAAGTEVELSFRLTSRAIARSLQETRTEIW